MQEAYRFGVDPAGGGDVELAEGLVLLAATIVRLLPREITLLASGVLIALQRGGPQRITDLAASEGITQPGMTDLVSRLELRDLARRRRDQGDKRVVWVDLTPAGEEYLRSRYLSAAKQLAAVLAELSDEEVKGIRAAAPALARVRQIGVSCSPAPSTRPMA